MAGCDPRDPPGGGPGATRGAAGLLVRTPGHARGVSRRAPGCAERPPLRRLVAGLPPRLNAKAAKDAKKRQDFFAAFAAFAFHVASISRTRSQGSHGVEHPVDVVAGAPIIHDARPKRIAAAHL